MAMVRSHFFIYYDSKNKIPVALILTLLLDIFLNTHNISTVVRLHSVRTPYQSPE